MILSIDQFGTKTLHKDNKIKTLLSDLSCVSAKPIYRDIEDKSIKTGYCLTHRGYTSLWIELFELKGCFT